jgi:RNA polymerase sigma-70 factor (ECF subfamily)
VIFFQLSVSNKVKPDGWEEPRLIARLKQGDETAFKVLIEKYRHRLFSIAYGITQDREDSLDIVQEVFVKVFRNIGRFQEKSKLSTWLYRITVNHCLNWQRRWKRRLGWQHHSFDTTESNAIAGAESGKNDPESILQGKELEKMIQMQLAALPDKSRAVFVLKELEGLSYDEIAKILKIKRGTVSSRLFNARKKITAGLRAYGR